MLFCSCCPELQAALSQPGGAPWLTRLQERITINPVAPGNVMAATGFFHFLKIRTMSKSIINNCPQKKGWLVNKRKTLFIKKAPHF
jgi:hypothetical protein